MGQWVSLACEEWKRWVDQWERIWKKHLHTVSISLHLARSLHMLPSVHFEITLKSGYNQRPEISSNLPKTLYTIGKWWNWHLTQFWLAPKCHSFSAKWLETVEHEIFLSYADHSIDFTCFSWLMFKQQHEKWICDFSTNCLAVYVIVHT